MKNYFFSIFYGIAWLTIGTKCLISQNVYWNWLGFILYVVGFVLIALASWWTMWDKFIEKTQAMQYLFDSARHLDKDRISDLLIAMGLKPITEQFATSTMTVKKYDKQGSYTGAITYKDIPARPDQLTKLAAGIINERAAFSRPEWTTTRATFTDGEFRRLKEWFWNKKLIELINPANANVGYRFTPGAEGGIEFLESYLPSPAPQMEVVGNQ